MSYIKISDFWEVMCKKLGYNLYLGSPTLELKLLFDTMSPENLHYIPTISEAVAVNMASGAYMSGVKSVVLISTKQLELLDYNINKFNIIYNIPFLFVTGNDFNPLNIKQFVLNKKLSILHDIDDYMYKTDFKPSILVLPQGVLS